MNQTEFRNTGLAPAILTLHAKPLDSQEKCACTTALSISRLLSSVTVGLRHQQMSTFLPQQVGDLEAGPLHLLGQHQQATPFI